MTLSYQDRNQLEVFGLGLGVFCFVLFLVFLLVLIEDTRIGEQNNFYFCLFHYSMVIYKTMPLFEVECQIVFLKCDKFNLDLEKGSR